MAQQKRREFLNKLVLGISSVVALPFMASTNPSNREQNDNKMDAFKRIKPLGFQWETQDPFLFCVHHEDFYPKGNGNMGPADSLAGRYIGQDFIVKDGYRMYHGTKVPGFPGHPHRGFETITVVRTGLVDHADSLGAAGRYGNGDVQWMTAGKGVQHSEMFPLLNEDKENPLELFQIWLNLPRKNKMVEPHFKMMWNHTIPVIKEQNSAGATTEIEVIAGELQGNTAPTPPPDSWASEVGANVAVINIKMAPGATYTFPKTAKEVNRSVYFYKGNGFTVNGKEIPEYHAADVHAEFDLEFANTSDEDIKILILQGKPINEPVVQHGPFVMNTREEIQQAFEDYHRTQFGGWPWPKSEQVHDKDAGRFALHADGTKEVQ